MHWAPPEPTLAPLHAIFRNARSTCNPYISNSSGRHTEGVTLEQKAGQMYIQHVTWVEVRGETSAHPTRDMGGGEGRDLAFGIALPPQSPVLGHLSPVRNVRLDALQEGQYLALLPRKPLTGELRLAPGGLASPAPQDGQTRLPTAPTVHMWCTTLFPWGGCRGRSVLFFYVHSCRTCRTSTATCYFLLVGATVLTSMQNQTMRYGP